METQNTEKQKKWNNWNFTLEWIEGNGSGSSRSGRRGSRIIWKSCSSQWWREWAVKLLDRNGFVALWIAFIQFHIIFIPKFPFILPLPLPNGTVPLMMIMIMMQSDGQSSPSSWVSDCTSGFGIGTGKSSFPALRSPSSCHGVAWKEPSWIGCAVLRS